MISLSRIGLSAMTSPLYSATKAVVYQSDETVKRLHYIFIKLINEITLFTSTSNLCKVKPQPLRTQQQAFGSACRSLARLLVHCQAQLTALSSRCLVNSLALLPVRGFARQATCSANGSAAGSAACQLCYYGQGVGGQDCEVLLAGFTCLSQHTSIQFTFTSLIEGAFAHFNLGPTQS